MKQPRGKPIIAPDLNVWPHEYETAKALAMAGITVEFIRRSEEYRTTSADVIINGAERERAIERELHKWDDEVRCLKHLIFANRHGTVIDIT